MTTKANLKKMAKVKMNLIGRQKSELFSLINDYVKKFTPTNLDAFTTEQSNRELNIELDSALTLLMQACATFHSKFNTIERNLQPELLEAELNWEEAERAREELPSEDFHGANFAAVIANTVEQIHHNRDRIELIQNQVHAVRNLNSVTKEDIKLLNDRCNDLQQRSNDLAETLEQTQVLNEMMDKIRKVLQLLSGDMDINAEINRDESDLSSLTVSDVNLQERHQVVEMKLNLLEKVVERVGPTIASKIMRICRLENILSERQQRTSQLDFVEERIRNLTDLYNNISQPDFEMPLSGFTAYLSDTAACSLNTIIAGFTNVLWDEGAHFNKTLGVYVAPVRAVYLVSVNMRQIGKGKIGVHVKRRPANGDTTLVVCKALSCKSGVSTSCVGIVRLDAEDTIFVKIIRLESTPKLSNLTSFSCCMIA